MEPKLTSLQVNPKELEALRENLIRHLIQFELVDKVYSFGSFARGDWDAWSDTDLLLITSCNPTLKELLDTLASFRPLLHRSNFAIQTEPAGGYLLGILFKGTSVFHNLDLNFMTIEQHMIPLNLERFGVLELLHENSREAMLAMPSTHQQNETPPLGSHEQQLEYAIHWIKKAIKKVLRGQPSSVELEKTSTKLSQLLAIPNERWSERGDIGKVAHAFLEMAGELLQDINRGD